MGGEGGVGGGGGGGGGMLVGKGSSGSSSSSKCGRWNPTGEQVKVLTELFRSGLRTPSSDQIQKISHQLSFYGNIESKNVFYWFQNHKARERQKRRKLDHNTTTTSTTTTTTQQQHFIHPLYHHNNINLLPPSSNHFADESTRTRTRNKSIVELEPERMMKTLQLFPINSIDEAEGGLSDDDHHHHHEFRVNNNGFKKHYKLETKMDHPPLDLRLSFL